MKTSIGRRFFSADERKRYFCITERLKSLLAILRTPANQVCFNMHGEYDFSDETLQDSVGLRLPKKLGLEAV